MMNDKAVLKRFQRDYKTSRSKLSNQYKDIKESYAFYSGDYMKYRDYFDFGTGARGGRVRQVQFNRVKPYVNSIAGFFAQIRGKPDYQAVTPEDKEQLMYSEYLNNVSDYIRSNTNSPQIETQQDKDMLICGVGVTDTSITIDEGVATRDPHGEIVQERVFPSDCGWDSEAREPNLLDSRWCWRVKDYYVEDAEELFDAKESDFEPSEAETGPYSFLPGGGIQDKIAYEFADYDRKMVRVYFYQWYEVENFYRIENPVYSALNEGAATDLYNAFQSIPSDTGDELFSFNPDDEILVITKENRPDVSSIFKEFGIPFKPFTQKRRVYYTAVVSGEHVFDHFKSQSQQGFSMKFKTGDYDEVGKIWTGVVASMKEPVKYYNKALTELMLIIAYNSKGGVMIEEGAVEDIQDFERKYSRTDSVVLVNEHALSGGKIMPKQTPLIPTGYENIIALSDDAISKVTGLSEQFFGATASGNETAMLQRQKIKQATTILAGYVDNIMLYQKEQARLLLSFIRILAETSAGKIFTAYSEEGDLIMEKLDPEYFVDEYQIKIGDSPETPLQKEYYTQTLVGIAQAMQQVGDTRYLKLYAAAVKYMPLPEKDKAGIIDALTDENQVDPRMVQQLQAQLQQLSGQQQQLMNARMVADIGETKMKTEKIKVDIESSAADTIKTKEETEKLAIENDIMAIAPSGSINVTI